MKNPGQELHIYIPENLFWILHEIHGLMLYHHTSSPSTILPDPHWHPYKMPQICDFLSSDYVYLRIIHVDMLVILLLHGPLIYFV